MIEICNSLLSNCLWGHNVLLIEKVKDVETRQIYAEATIKNGWSRNVLAMQIESNYHLRIGSNINNFNNLLPFMKDMIKKLENLKVLSKFFYMK